MKVFRIDRIDAKEMSLIPTIPLNTASDEDKITKRICCSMSLNGCLSAVDNFDYHDKLTVYESDVQISFLYQPTEKQVFDVFLTGELWILQPTVFKKYGTLEITGYIGQDYMERVNNQYSFIYRRGND